MGVGARGGRAGLAGSLPREGGVRAAPDPSHAAWLGAASAAPPFSSWPPGLSVVVWATSARALWFLWSGPPRGGGQGGRGRAIAARLGQGVVGVANSVSVGAASGPAPRPRGACWAATSAPADSLKKRCPPNSLRRAATIRAANELGCLD